MVPPDAPRGQDPSGGFHRGPTGHDNPGVADPSASVTEFRVTARSRAREDLLWYMRHADALARWPVLSEPWAQRLEHHRLNPDDERAGTRTAAE